MPSDDYAAVGGGGALRLKGAKVSKKKKKDKKKKSDLEKNLTGNDERDKEDNDGSERKADDAEHVKVEIRKTESELRYEETRKKRLLDMAKAQGARPELLKTHKERVEELNTYLSKLSEHHDMPKIGPG
ncbi:hypothetical protein N3K66_006866 [Trichothecium roseum]|uniref:Uncharacterized protein n=1 Tax=Trichothecium roseum TaxID=47278 RepID=A0ACC0UWK0_9HYPO|nr:hypothetical protein N3K66_006866 [Trichothecium roseum]